MKATIFHLDHQTNQAHKLAEMLRRSLYAGTQTTLVDVDRLSGAELADRYFKHLQAAADPLGALRFSIVRQEWLGYRLYIYVYHSLWSGAIHPSGCFPAISIEGGRMIVPAHMRAHVGGRTLFRAFDLSGLLEVDVYDQTAMESALAQVAQSARAEALRNIAAAAAYGDADLTVIAARAGLDVTYAEHVLQSAASDRSTYRQISSHLKTRSLAMGEWTKVELRIANHLDEEQRELTISIHGPVQVRPEAAVVTIAPRSEVQVPFALMPEQKGEFPIELRLVLASDRLLHRWLPVQHFWLKAM